MPFLDSSIPQGVKYSEELPSLIPVRYVHIVSPLLQTKENHKDLSKTVVAYPNRLKWFRLPCLTIEKMISILKNRRIIRCALFRQLWFY